MLTIPNDYFSHLSKALCAKSQTADGDTCRPFSELFSPFFLEVKQAVHFFFHVHSVEYTPEG